MLYLPVRHNETRDKCILALRPVRILIVVLKNKAAESAQKRYGKCLLIRFTWKFPSESHLFFLKIFTVPRAIKIVCKEQINK